MTFQLSIGADPEIFVGFNNKFISAHGMVEGTKEQPFKIKDGAVQVDGMALEFNIEPVHNVEDFHKNISSVTEQLKGMIGDKEFLKTCSVFFDEQFLKDVPPQNLELGCMPDYNAYTLGPNEQPDNKTMMRTAGGHIHLGDFEIEEQQSYEHYDLAATLARAMDKYVGVYSLLWDKDDNRRSLYGQAGAFRPKSYGAEYRTLSNMWIFSKDITSFIYRQTEMAVEAVLSGDKIHTKIFQNIINNSDRENSFFKSDTTAQEVMEMVHG
jgi:hypothetical protein